MLLFMGDLIRSLRRFVFCLLLLAAAAVFASCAHEKPALVDDPDSKQEGQMPWNKQEKWETQGQMAGITDRR
jgi:outer membrane biogenesis lipoprotein LolB